MNWRLLLDEDVHLALATALRKRGYDAIHVVSKQLPVGESLRRLLLLMQKQNPALMKTQLHFL